MNQIALWLRLWIIVAIAAPAARLAAQDADTPLTPEQAQEMFAATFGTEVERIAASPTKTDDVEFAKQMLIVARGGKQRAELINVMLEHARRFGSATPDGYETAIEAMRLLIERDPSRAGDLYAEIVTLRQRQYSATRGEERVEIGKAWLDDQLAAAEAKARDNDWAEAQAMYRQAMTVATRADPTRKPDIQAAIDAMRDHMLVEAKIDRLKANIKSAQEASNTALIKTTTDQLMKLYVVDLDTPNEARKYTFLSDDAELKANVPLACKDPADLDEEQAEQLAKWYHDLSRSATGKGKLATLERARGYYERYVELHGTDDFKGKTISTLTLKSIDGELERLAAANVVRTPTTASRIDWKRDREKVKYRWLKQNMSKGSWKYDDPEHTLLTDGVAKARYHDDSIAWNLVQAKPSPVVFNFGRVVRPKMVRVYLHGADAPGGLSIPPYVRVYTGSDTKPGRPIAELKPVPDKTGWHDIALPRTSASASRYFWIEIGAETSSRTKWILIEEVEFH